VLNHIIPYSTEVWMVLVTVVMVAYTLLGGMRTITVSDVIQFAMMMAAILILFPYALSYTPDFIAKTPAENLTPFTYLHDTPQDAVRWTILLLFLPMTSAPLYQRFFASLDNVDKKKALAYSVVAYFIMDMILLSCGMIAAANAETLGITEENADVALLILGYTILPNLIKIFFIVGMFSATFSSADSWIHAGASSLSYDVFRRVFRWSDKKLLLASRFSVVFLGGLSLVLALWFGDIIAAISFMFTVWISGIVFPTTVALLGRKMTENAALTSMAAGSLSAILCGVHPLAGVDPLFVGLGFSVLVGLIARKLDL